MENDNSIVFCIRIKHLSLLISAVLTLFFSFADSMTPAQAQRIAAPPSNKFAGLSISPDESILIAFDTGLETDSGPGSSNPHFPPSVYQVPLNGSDPVKIVDFIKLSREPLLDPTFISNDQIITGEYDSTINIWNLSTKTSRTLKEGGSYTCIHSLPGGGLLIGRQEDMRLTELKEKLEFHSGVPVSYQIFHGQSGDVSPDRKRLLLIGNNYEKTVIIWDLDQKREIWAPEFRKGPGGQIAGGFISNDQVFLASSKIQILDLEKKVVQNEFPPGESDQTVYSHDLSADRSLLAVGGHSEVVVWDLSRGEEVAKIPGFSGEVVDVVFLKDSTRLAAVDRYQLQIWDFKKNQKIREIHIRDIQLK